MLPPVNLAGRRTFLARPMRQNGAAGGGAGSSADAMIGVEIVDITDWGSDRTLEAFLREDAALVR